MKILITGASGFVGSKYFAEFRISGAEIFGTDIWGVASESLIIGDLTEESFLENLFEKIKPDVVVHAAALVPLTKDLQGYRKFNVETSGKIAAISGKYGVSKFVLISSSAPYGVPTDFPIKKSTIPTPIEEYGQSKLDAEEAIRDNLGDEIALTIIRPRTILGSGRLGIFEILFRWIEENHDIPFPNAAKHYLQLVHIDDLLALTEHLIKTDQPGIWPAGTPNYSRLDKDLNDVIKAVGSKTKLYAVNASLFEFAGWLLESLKLSPFSKWHYKTLNCNFAFSSDWTPNGFTYRYSNLEALLDVWRSRGEQSLAHDGLSPHTKKWPTKLLDYLLKTLTRIRRIADLLQRVMKSKPANG
jgi:nucleoside-diphosphate-sugar epimerase